MLQADLEHHRKSLAEMRDPNYGKAKNRKGGLSIESQINVQLLIPSYVKIIKSIEDEIAELTSKKSPKKTAPKKEVAVVVKKTAPKKTPAKKAPTKKTAKKKPKKK
jgi:hypothetical protein